METDAQITSWPGYDGIVREAGYTNATYPVTQNAEMACITGGVHIRAGALRRPGGTDCGVAKLPGGDAGASVGLLAYKRL